MASKKHSLVVSHQAVVSAAKPKVIRRTSTKAFGCIENNFNSITAKYISVENDIKVLKAEIKLRKTVLSFDEKTEEPITAGTLNSFAIALRRKQLAEKQTELKVLKGKFKSVGQNLTTASKRSEEAAKYQSKKITLRVELSRQAVKDIDKIKAVVKTFIKSMRKTNDVRVSTLQALATTNGRRFYTDVQNILRNAEFQADIKAMISASAPVRTELSNMIRTSFGWSRDNR